MTQVTGKLASFDRGYIGSFYCSGLSLNKGKGYITNGARVHVERNKTQTEKDQEKAEKELASGKGKTSGKATTVIKNGKVIKGGGAAKQSTLSGFGAGKKATASAVKTVKKIDAVVRFNNDRGFEVGRLPAGDAAFISPLLDPGMIELSGTVVDAPASLTVGCDILLNLKVYLTKKAFEENVMQAGKGGEEEERARAGGFWQQQGETEDEKRMRLRKAALDKLFSEPRIGVLHYGGVRLNVRSSIDRMGIKPIRSSALTKAQKAKGKGLINEDALAHFGESATGMPAYVKRKAQSRSVSPEKGIASSVKGKANGTRASSQTASGSGSRAVSPTKKVKPAKGKAKEGDLEEESDVESGDEAELLNESQLNELEDIYKRYDIDTNGHALRSRC